MRPVLVLVVVVIASISYGQSQRPNIVFILADDLGYADIEGFGSKVKTPQLAKLQKEGMRFTSFYSQPQCSPSRAALLTGCYPQRVGIPWVVGPEGPAWTKDKFFVGLNPSEQTLPELLKEAGYKTACIGKWHIGHLPEHLPLKHGFDEFFGLPYSNDMIPERVAEYPPLPLMDGADLVETNPDQSLLTKRYTERAVNFISSNKATPFFLYLAHSMPHVPIYVSKQFAGKTGAGLYADVITELDWSVGEIMRALKSNALDENTLVIFTSDNGPWLPFGNHAGSAGQFREGKATTFEGGVRVPMIARWPGQVKGGTSCARIAGLIDILPTIVEVASLKAPTLKTDGQSILSLLRDPSAAAPRDAHYFFQINELQAVRKGKWKLHLPHDYEHLEVAGVDGSRGKVSMVALPLSLFDLDNDPGELTNVADKNPLVVQELKKLADDFSNELKSQKRPAGVAQQQH